MFTTNSQEERFISLASQIIDSGADSARGLESSILKVSQELDFNSEQIKRLCESTNQLMYAKMLNSDDNKFDKTASFPIADPKNVISQYYKSEKKAEMAKVASEVSRNMWSYYMPPEKIRDSFMEKTASERELPEKPQKTDYEKRSAARKIRESLTDEKARLQWKIAECVDRLASEFSYDTGPDQATFEKKAFVYFGDECMPFLNIVREQMHLPRIKNFSGIEKIGRIIIDTRAKEFELLKTAMDSAQEYSSISGQLSELINLIGEY